MTLSIFRLFIVAWRIFELDTNGVSHRLDSVFNLTLLEEGISLSEKLLPLAWPVGMSIVHFLNG